MNNITLFSYNPLVDIEVEPSNSSDSTQADTRTLHFTAITSVPISETTSTGQPYNLQVDLDSTTFAARKLYKDHIRDTDHTIGKIIQHKLRDRSDGFKEIVMSVEFTPNAQDSELIYHKFKHGTLDSVSIGISGCDVVKSKDGTVVYKNGTIHEVSVVHEGRDPNAKIRDSFQQRIESPELEQTITNLIQETTMSTATTDVVNTNSTEFQNTASTEKINSFDLNSVIAGLTDSIRGIVADELGKHQASTTNASSVAESVVEPAVAASFELMKSKTTTTSTDLLAPITAPNIIATPTEAEFSEMKRVLYGHPNPYFFESLIAGKATYGTQPGHDPIPFHQWNIEPTREEKNRKPQITLPWEFFLFVDDLQLAKDTGAKLKDIIHERFCKDKEHQEAFVQRMRNQSDTFEVGKTTDILPIIPTPRDTTHPWDAFKKYSPFISAIRSMNSVEGLTYELPIEGKEFTMKGYPEGSVTEIQKYAVTKVSVKSETHRMAVSWTMEAGVTSNIDLRVHVPQLVRKDFLIGMENIILEGSGTAPNNNIKGIFKLEDASIEKNTDFMKAPDLKKFVNLRKTLRKNFYNIEGAKLVVNTRAAQDLSVALTYGNNIPSPDNVRLMKNGVIDGTSVIVTDGISNDASALFGRLENIVLFNFQPGLSMEFHRDVERNTTVTLWHRFNYLLLDKKSVVICKNA